MSTTATACPECDGRLHDDGTETVCGECGLVVAEDALDRGPDWRSFAEDDGESRRCGAPLTRSRHDRGLSTDIGRSTRLTGRKRRRVARMRTQNRRAQIPSKTDRNQVYSFTEIKRLVSALELGDPVREQSCALFESAQDADLLRGRSLEGFAAATVYAVCRVNGIARTEAEITARAKADPDELRVAYDALNREVGLPTGPIDPREYLARFASDLGLGRETEAAARDLADRADELGLTVGRNPCGVAAACLYTAAREREEDLTQAEAAAAADVTPVTLRSTYQALKSK